jgi:hypothetical protein
MSSLVAVKYKNRVGRKTRSSQTRSNLLVSSSARLGLLEFLNKLSLGRIISQLEPAREPLTSQNEPILINNPTKYIVASLAHDHNPQPAKEPEVHNVDGDIEFVEFPTCMVGSVSVDRILLRALFV